MKRTEYRDPSWIFPFVAYTPEHAEEKLPLVIQLHGAGERGAGQEDLKLVDIHGFSALLQKQDFPCITVMPQCPKDSFWAARVESIIEFVAQLKAYFPVDESRVFLTGLSMGGHGAMWNAIRHQDVFGAVGTTSGGMDIRPFPNNWGMKKYLGERDENLEVWNNHTVINQLDRLKDGALAIIIDCGVDDFFFGVNKAVHERLLQQKVGHDFIARPGAHNSAYWNNSIGYQIKFFKKYFEKE